MTDLNMTLPFVDPLVMAAQSIMKYVQVLVGGVFGLYVIMAIMRWYTSRQVFGVAKDIQKNLRAIHNELEEMNAYRKKKVKAELKKK